MVSSPLELVCATLDLCSGSILVPLNFCLCEVGDGLSVIGYWSSIDEHFIDCGSLFKMSFMRA